jgi:integrase
VQCFDGFDTFRVVKYLKANLHGHEVAMPKKKLTAKFVETTRPDPGKQIDYFDIALSSFGLRVSSKGGKSWFVHRKVLTAGVWKTRRITLGSTAELSLAEARRLAETVIEDCKAGKDPSNIRKTRKGELEQRSADTYASVREQFLTRYVGKGGRRPAPRTLQEMRNALSSDVLSRWEQRPITEISERDILDALDALIERDAPIASNRLLAYLKSLFAWSKSRHIIATDPTLGIRKQAPETARDRVLSLDEVKALWEATDPAKRPQGDLYTPIVRVLLLTGQRRMEVAQMEWTEIEDDLWTIPPSRTKNGTSHAVPLSDAVLDLIENQRELQAELELSTPYVFSTTGARSFQNWSREKRALDETLGFSDWRLHDIRRTVATHMDDQLRVSPWIVESVLNHLSGSKAGVAGTYNRAERVNERRSALEAWSRFIAELVGESDQSNVVPIRAN